MQRQYSAGTCQARMELGRQYPLCTCDLECRDTPLDLGRRCWPDEGSKTQQCKTQTVQQAHCQDSVDHHRMACSRLRWCWLSQMNTCQGHTESGSRFPQDRNGPVGMHLDLVRPLLLHSNSLAYSTQSAQLDLRCHKNGPLCTGKVRKPHQHSNFLSGMVHLLWANSQTFQVYEMPSLHCRSSQVRTSQCMLAGRVPRSTCQVGREHSPRGP